MVIPRRRKFSSEPITLQNQFEASPFALIDDRTSAPKAPGKALSAYLPELNGRIATFPRFTSAFLGPVPGYLGT